MTSLMLSSKLLGLDPCCISSESTPSTAASLFIDEDETCTEESDASSAPSTSTRYTNISRSYTTNSLLTDDAEWWVLRNDEDDPDEDDVSDGESDDEEVVRSRPFLQLRMTVLGTEPDDDPGTHTPWFKRGLLAPVRHMSAGHRNRYIWNGFDLDLTYITSRVIAMGFPGGKSRAAFRNPRSEVARFLDWAHPGHFRIYNLCCEPSHTNNGFRETTVHFPCMDHCPPALPVMLDFCRNAVAWLQSDPDNVIAVHCKAGKGRTGCMICALMIFTGSLPSAHQALRWYELMRGGTHSGVTIPSQIRWTAMFERWMRCQTSGLHSDPMNELGYAPKYRLRSICAGPFRTRPRGAGCRGGSFRAPSLGVGLIGRADMENSKDGYWYEKVNCELSLSNTIEVVFPRARALEIGGLDGTLRLHVKQPKVGTVKMRVWWHHAFLRRLPDPVLASYQLNLKKEWIDGLQYDMEKDRKVPASFAITATFELVRPEHML